MGITDTILKAFGAPQGTRHTKPATPQHIVDARKAEAAERRARKNAKRLKDAGL